MYFVCPIAYIIARQELSVLTTAFPCRIINIRELSMAIPWLVVISISLFHYTIAD